MAFITSVTTPSVGPGTVPAKKLPEAPHSRVSQFPDTGGGGGGGAGDSSGSANAEAISRLDPRPDLWKSTL